MREQIDWTDNHGPMPDAYSWLYVFDDGEIAYDIVIPEEYTTQAPAPAESAAPADETESGKPGWNEETGQRLHFRF